MFFFNITDITSVNEFIMNKGQWIKDEHNTFLLGWEQYCNNWENVATVVQLQTPLQIKTC